jgi:hypothetical protein
MGQTEQHQNQTRPVSLFHSQHTQRRNNCNSQHSVLRVIAPVVVFLSSIELVYVITIKNSIRKETKKIKGHCPVPVLFFVLSLIIGE